MMRAIVTELVVAVLVAMLAVGAIGAFSSSNPKPLEPVKVGRLDEFPESSPLRFDVMRECVTSLSRSV